MPARALVASTAHLAIDRSSAVPLHRQVYDGLRAAILAGRLPPGARLPSSRMLAAELGVACPGAVGGGQGWKSTRSTASMSRRK